MERSEPKRIRVKKNFKKAVSRDDEIFITSKTNFKKQQKYCEDKLNSGAKEIYLHCTGKTISRGINLVLSLVSNSNNTLSYSVNTSTIQFIDELHPLSDDDDILFNRRQNSAVHIKITRAAEQVYNT